MFSSIHTQSISFDQNVVLNKWKEAFEELLNTNVVSADDVPGEMVGDYPVLSDTMKFVLHLPQPKREKQSDMMKFQWKCCRTRNEQPIL